MGVQSGCAAKEQRQPLASDAVIDAAERAPLDPFAVSGRWNKPFVPFTVIGNIHYVDQGRQCLSDHDTRGSHPD